MSGYTRVVRTVLALTALMAFAAAACGESFDDVFKAVRESTERPIVGALREGRLVFLRLLDEERMEPISDHSGEKLPAFLDEAVDRGLRDCWRGTHEDFEGAVYHLSFRKTEAEDLTFGSRRLRLPPDVFEYFRTVRSHRLDEAGVDRMAVVIHEPHSSVFAQYQLIAGLYEIRRANRDRLRFSFLVEGDYENDDRRISMAPLNKLLADPSTRNPLILRMLRDHVIDGPLAYRLLVKTDLPAYAIDDRELIGGTPRRVLPKEDLTEKFPSVKRAAELVAKGPRDEKEYERSIQDLQTEIRKLQARDPQAAELETLRAWVSEMNVFLPALKRDATMAQQIQLHLKNDPEVVPFIFIGNFHTEGILQLLPKNLGAVVLEPREQRHNEEEFEAFQGMLHNRKAYIARWAKGLKGPTAPTADELPLIGQGLTKRAAGLSRWEAETRRNSTLGKEATEKLLRTLKHTGPLLEAEVVFGGDGPRLPGAFASFRPAERDRPGQLAIHDKQPTAWGRASRWALFRHALIAPPKAPNGRRAKIYYEDGKCSFAVYDAATDRVYLFDNVRKADLLRVMNPTGKPEKDALLRLERMAHDQIWRFYGQIV